MDIVRAERLIRTIKSQYVHFLFQHSRVVGTTDTGVRVHVKTPITKEQEDDFFTCALAELSDEDETLLLEYFEVFGGWNF